MAKEVHAQASNRHLYQLSNPLCLCPAVVQVSVDGIETRKQVTVRPTSEGWTSDIEQCLCATFVFIHKGLVIFFISRTMLIVCLPCVHHDGLFVRVGEVCPGLASFRVMERMHRLRDYRISVRCICWDVLEVCDGTLHL